MRLSPEGQGVMLALLLGFVATAILIHVIELVLLAASVRAWLLMTSCLLAVITMGGLGVLYLGHQLHLGLRIVDVMTLLGAQFALAVCLPTRFLRWRIRQCNKLLHLARTPVNARPLAHRSGLLGGRRRGN